MNWWELKKIIRQHNHNACGKYLTGLNDGLNQIIKEDFSGLLPFKNVLSIGCGHGAKEAELQHQGIVYKLALIDPAPRKLSENLREHKFYPVRFEDFHETGFDAVYWNNSLHHMTSSKWAIDKSYEILKPGGVFIGYEYIGPNRFQWWNSTLKYATELRAKIKQPPVKRPAIINVTRKDPNEAADSESIVDNFVASKFQSIKIINTGGAIYHPFFSGIEYIDETEPILFEMLTKDSYLLKFGISHYAILMGEKI